MTNLRRICMVVGFVLLVAAVATTMVFAASPVRQIIGIDALQCFNDHFDFQGTATVEFGTPSDETGTERINGVVTRILTTTNGVVSFSGPLSATYAFAPQPGNYDFQLELVFFVNGQPVWRNIIGFSCISGVPTDIFVTNEDLTLSAGCTLTVPVGSVVGEAPLGAQAYYEPGNIAPGVVLNPGTYIVIGQDASETYYKIVLSCQYLWVRKDTMQPSYLPPQNGAPLPTTVVI